MTDPVATSTLTNPTSHVALDAVRAAGVVAVLRGPDPESTIRAVDALVAGGVTGIEVTYSTPDAPRVIATVRARHGDAIALGAGTLTRPEQAVEAVDAGASFLVSPGTRPALAAAMTATGAVCMFGALTPSEVMLALELGADVVKIFPASLGGPAYLKALRGPFGDAALMPTGGVSVDNVGEWVAAGVVAVGAGGELCSPALMAAGRFGEIEHRARAFADAWDDATGAAR